MALIVTALFLASGLFLVSASACIPGERSAVDCERYKECSSGGQEKLFKCPVFHRFDPGKKKCVWYTDYACARSIYLAGVNGACANGEVHAEDNCTKYSMCENGKWLSLTCPQNYLFDSFALRCVHSADARCLSCPEDSTEDGACTTYYTCEQGQKVPQTCGSLQYWDDVTKRCVYWGANCVPGRECYDNGKKFSNGDCKSYRECVSGRLYEKSCGVSRFYDELSGKCVWVFPWATCVNKSPAPECSLGDVKLLDCRRYAKCVNGSWTVQQCKDGETFNNRACRNMTCSVKKVSCTSYEVNGVHKDCKDGEIYDEFANTCVRGHCRPKRDAIDSAVVNHDPTDSPRVLTTTPNHKPTDSPRVRTTAPAHEPTDSPRVRRSTPTQEPTTVTHSSNTAKNCTEGEKSPDKNDCQAYTVCTNGQWVSDHCLWPRKFDSEDKTCKWSGAKCATTPSYKPTDSPRDPTTTPTHKPTDSPTAINCTEGEKLPDKNDCRAYTVCTNGQWVSDHCLWPRKFDSEDKTCKWSGAKCTPAPTYKPTDSPTAKNCTEGEKVPDKKDCRAYTVCTNGQWVSDHCWWPRQFDSEDKTCKYSGAKCAS